MSLLEPLSPSVAQLVPKTKTPRPRMTIGDEARFFSTWLRSPLTMGAVSPSSRLLGQTMAAYLPDPEEFDDRSVVLELGPGTGVVTQCLIERGVPESALVLVEFSEEFCGLLRARFPNATIVQGDAYAIAADLGSILGQRRLEAVVSGLPLLTKPDAMREEVVRHPLSVMEEGAPFIQFSYSLKLPVRPEAIDAQVETSPWVKRNLPPARVIVYRAG
ncbi:rRNA adenine N-6-methyltransferase family protein [Fulvimarina sp. 2208YS6-2-32]|uniref:rRNA adenine N-6-methyltransferase family protein n=1 Tax=Fulvimarina uroteuthidis TaxID=3098149 RepID=A0ABU5HZ46_9HYPH|nr:methyltransferase domain-containing protein [Fulvimarina sp. 2208YS6-2-32]MDY8108352.1 rRNA adenine N-6-methyltransferase family protein [Fulvimarina sp. 2208YS6-2-32]